MYHLAYGTEMVSSKFYRNSEAKTADFLENIEDMFLIYC